MTSRYRKRTDLPPTGSSWGCYGAGASVRLARRMGSVIPGGEADRGHGAGCGRRGSGRDDPDAAGVLGLHSDRAPGWPDAGRMPQTPGDPGRVRTSARDHPAGRIRQAAGPGNAAAAPAAVVSWLAGRRRMRLPRTSAPLSGARTRAEHPSWSSILSAGALARIL